MSSSKRLAIITSDLGATSETFVTRHIQKLNEGNNVILYKRGTSESITDKNNYRIQPLWWHQMHSIIRKICQVPHSLQFGFSEVPHKNERIRIKKFLLENKVTCILAEFGPLGCMMLPIAKKLNIPIYTYFRGYDASNKLREWKFRHAYRRLIPKMDGIFAVSPHLIKNLENIGVHWKQAHIVPSGVDTDLFKPGRKQNNLFLSVGRFVEKKAPQITVAAFAKVLETNPDSFLKMIGDGPLLKSVIEQSKSLGIYNRIKFMGAQPHHIIQEEMSKASIFLLHSVTDEKGNTEGFPSVIQEAMASGCAIISTRHGGIPYFVSHEEDGVLVNEYDIDGYTKEMVKLIRCKNWLKKLSSKARETAVENFNYKKLYSKLEAILAKSISN